MGSFLDFGGRAVSGFRRSQGFLLAGAVAYYTLLAIVPLFVVLLVGLSHVVDEHRLLDTVASNLQLVIHRLVSKHQRLAPVPGRG